LPGSQRIEELRATPEYQAAQLQAMRDTVDAVAASSGEEADGHRRWINNALAENWLQTLTTAEEVATWEAAGSSS
jgi:hypothetical protein